MKHFVLALAMSLVGCVAESKSLDSGNVSDGNSESAEESGTDSSGGTDGGSTSGTTATIPQTSSGSDSGGPIGVCGLAIGLDDCCQQPIPATAEELAADPCLVQWPYEDAELPDGLFESCLMLQSNVCQLSDCGPFGTDPASAVVKLDEAGECVTVCPEMTEIAYSNPGCDFPTPSIAECLPPTPPCEMQYCSCAGETVVGCGRVSEPFEYEGPCE